MKCALWGRDPFEKGSPPPRPHPLKLLLVLVFGGGSSIVFSILWNRAGADGADKKACAQRQACQQPHRVFHVAAYQRSRRTVPVQPLFHRPHSRRAPPRPMAHGGA
ncbi:hypothetical protein KL86DES1_10593 [uncultured Desulfovibrio sp.]|uniref:Uncharacterized protein n=1 Tax=uncultured Desulfovibrio sp. TaxID=167968 RepID=A0A212KZM1_9BACT|nr:hypothetical protein KL86DES1_10593 [uncultured Desulfovibrio sp.]VZH32469.1 conserved protein of unknown function [Desulfovibrio sp. 86]